MGPVIVQLAGGDDWESMVSRSVCPPANRDCVRFRRV